MRSHPLRVRGLKLSDGCNSNRRNLSHPLRVRGLKLGPFAIPFHAVLMSHPLRVRGLKPPVLLTSATVFAMSHPLRVRGLKQRQRNGNPAGQKSHPLRVRGLKLPLPKLRIYALLSHPLRVRGLKQSIVSPVVIGCPVAPFTGATIKLLSRFNPLFSSGLYRKVPIISGTSRPFFHQPPSETVTGFFGRTASRRSAPIQRKRYRKNIRNPAGNGNRLPDSPVPA